MTDEYIVVQNKQGQTRTVHKVDLLRWEKKGYFPLQAKPKKVADKNKNENDNE